MEMYNGNYKQEFDDTKYEEEFKKWANLIKSLAVKFYKSSIDIGKIKISPQIFCYEPNELLINKAVQDALSDIKRIKDYHSEVKNPEVAKYASYIGYWLSRAKPFNLKTNNYDAVFIGLQNDEQKRAKLNLCYSINEIFITEVILAITLHTNPPNEVITASDTCLTMRKSKELKITLLSTIKDALIYYLLYRSRGPQELELFLIGLLACPIQTGKDWRAAKSSDK